MSLVFFYHPFTQFENLGDAVINRLLLELLRDHGSVNVLSRGIPPDFWAKLQVREVEVVPGSKLSVLRSIAKEIFFSPNTVVWVSKPGDVVSLVGHLPFRRKIVKAMAYSVLNRLSVRLVAVGVSTRADALLSDRFEWFAANSFAARLVRDSGSYEASKNVCSPSYLGSDLAFLLRPQPFSNFDKGGPKAVGISFRDPGCEKQTSQIVSSLRSLKDAQGYELLPFFQVDRDRAFMEVIAARLGLERPKEVVFPMEAYDACAGMVSNRLHVLLFGWIRGATPVAVVDPLKNKKIIDLFTDLDQGKKMLAVGEEILPAHFEADRAADLRVIEAAKSRLLQAFEKLVSDLRGRDV